MSTALHPGDLLSIPLPDGRFGGAQVVEVTQRAVALQLFGVLLECAPTSALDFADAPVAVDHLPVKPTCIVEAVVGRAPVPPEALAGGYAAWVQAGRRTVIDAPLPALLQGLLAP